MSRERWVAVVPVQLDALAAVHGWSRTVRHLARRTLLDATWEPDETGAHVVTDFRDVESWAQHLGARRRTVADGLTVLAAAGWDYEPAAGHRPGRLAVPGELYRMLVQAPGDRRVDWSVWLRPDELDALAETQGWTFARRGRLEDVLCVADETGQLAATRTALAGMIGTDPSTLAPDLAAWTEAGITATEGRRVTVPGWSQLVRPAPDHVIAARRLARQTGRIVREKPENRPREAGKSSASPGVSPPRTGGTGVTENPSPSSVTAKAERAAEREGQGVGVANEVKDLAKETAKATGDTHGGMTTMSGAPGPWWADWADAVPACWRATLVGQLTAADQAGGVRALRRARAGLEARLGVDAARQAIAEDWPHPVDSPIGFLLQRARRRIAEHDERQGYADDDAAERAAEARRAAAGRARSTAAHVHLLLAQGETPAGIVECYRHAPTDTRETVTQTLTWLGFDPTAPVVPATGADGPTWDGQEATVEDYARARHGAGVAHQTILTEVARASQDPLWLTVRAAAAVLDALGQTAPAEAAPEPAPAAGGLAQARAELARSLGRAGRPPEDAGGPQEARSGPGGSAGPSGAPLAPCGGSGGRRAPGSTREDRR